MEDKKEEIVILDDDSNDEAKKPKEKPRRSRRTKRNTTTTPQNVAASTQHTFTKQNKCANKINDKRGVHIATGMDICDCLEDGCPGCHFPCPKCRSPKCGPLCRTNRTVPIDTVAVQGSARTLVNKYR